MEEDDFQYDHADISRDAQFTSISAPRGSSLWPFPDPNEGLDEFINKSSTNYLVEFEKWWENIQQNKRLIAQSEYYRLMKESERKFGKKIDTEL